jgi:hypothetical protein
MLAHAIRFSPYNANSTRKFGKFEPKTTIFKILKDFLDEPADLAGHFFGVYPWVPVAAAAFYSTGRGSTGPRTRFQAPAQFKTVRSGFLMSIFFFFFFFFFFFL